MTTQHKEMYNGKELTYDANSSRGMIIPIYHDVDGQLYMPLNERFVRIFRQSGIAAIYQPSLFFASSGKDKYDTCSAVFGFLIQPQKSKIRRKANAKVAKRTQL